MDRYTSKHPARNAIVILLAIALAESLVDLGCNLAAMVFP
jgi:hypothetical protein